MTNLTTLAAIALACTATAHAQMGRSQDWNTFASDSGRTGFERSDPRIAKDTLAKDFTLLYKVKLDEGRGPRPIAPPVIISTLISYRGFKELAFSGGANNTVYSINADFGKVFWQKPLIYSSEIPQLKDPWQPCGSAMTALVSLVPPPVFGRGGRGAPTRPATPPATPPRTLQSNGFGASRPVIALAGDGRVHRLNSANGDDFGGTPTRFLLPNARASVPNIADNVIYTSTNQGCGAVPNAIWAIDFTTETPTVTSFKTNGGGVWGLGGVAIGSDQTIYANLGDGPNKFSNTLLALSPRTLEVKQQFTAPLSATPKNIGMNAATPIVFTWKDRTVVANSGKDGRIYLLDAALTSLAKTAPLSDGATPDRGIYGLASWEDEQQNRWIAAAIWGPVAGTAANPNGGVVAFKVEDHDGQPELKQSWISRDLTAPLPPVIASGVVFALSAGDYTRTAKESYGGIATVEEKPKPTAHATLYAIDAATGKDIWTNRQPIATAAALTGLTVANGRVYFATVDGTFYCFGIPMEH